ncbi:GH25 family lysozyme [Streptomyces sp. NPDC007983]|uniref:GH25 family lysozyme n=1 Tax=Streptomyces sp. NPDC007983 TaxID=3364800 RepID=UPI0036EBB635
MTAGRLARCAAVVATVLAALVPEVTAHQAAASPRVPGALRGLDVSGYDGNVDWSSVAAKGAAFAYVKATEGTGYTSSYFAQQYNGAADAGLVRGAYHFARPDVSGGREQADYFVDHGGTWVADGTTLPGALDIEYNPHGDTCYGLTPKAMVGWIAGFRDEYRARTGRAPVIYTTTGWWSSCTGGHAGFGATDPLWIANHTGQATPLPAGWSTYTVWQTAGAGDFPGDQDVFNGTRENLTAFALGDYTPPPPAPAWPLVQQGQSGRRVTTVQYLLNARGASLAVDGQFGAGTREAVVAFQTTQGLTADGIVGPRTWQALVATVRQGDTGPAVRALQEELNAHGASLTVDGRFGTGTRDALAAFQTAHDLTSDGIAGPDTWLVLVS